MNPAPHKIGNPEIEKFEPIDFFFIKVICVNPAPQRGARMNTKGGAG
ncbi:hypothetical protein L6386_02235 [bacterium]|nr:hypothetical protein [bacterium]MBU4561493.1 hypothetical protein [bacterium]MCG2675816.1 hypothetical protein [bacterium]MCG2677370.1 hypothetical protein [bacterium]